MGDTAGGGKVGLGFGVVASGEGLGTSVSGVLVGSGIGVSSGDGFWVAVGSGEGSVAALIF